MRVYESNGWISKEIQIWDTSLSKMLKLMTKNLYQYTNPDCYKVISGSIKVSKYYSWYLHQQLPVRIGRSYKYRTSKLDGPVIITVWAPDQKSVDDLALEIRDILVKNKAKLREIA